MRSRTDTWRRLGCLLSLQLLVLVAGCGSWRTTLTATWVNSTPLPGMAVDEKAWNKARPLRVTLHKTNGSPEDRRVVTLWALHDDSALTIFAQWFDHHRSDEPRTWVWDEKRQDYDLSVKPLDEFAIMWPLEPADASFNMLDSRPARYDVWRWIAGWTDRSTVAEDMQLNLIPHPPDAKPNPEGGPLYPSLDGKKTIEIQWKADSGVPGIFPTRKPAKRDIARVLGLEVREGRGSAADVLATSRFGQGPAKGGKRTTWSLNGQPQDTPALTTSAGGFWTVVFYRRLQTATPEEDYQMATHGPHRFAIALLDDAFGADHYVSGPLRLDLQKKPASADKTTPSK